ncbi:MAG: hypothetical protein JWM55_1225 [Acidimicrobiaceae bacterium]|nr:hypothetical protein [Acidimicrobiaceae bacterium]
MPTYEYECQQCHERVEAVQKFTDPSLTLCPLCGGELRKVFSAVGIVFKGSGFYKNDSRGSKSTAKESSSATSDASSSSDASTTKTEVTPAPAATPATTSSSSTTD